MFEIRKHEYSNFVLLPQNCFYSSGSLEISYEFQDDFFSGSAKNDTRILVEIALHKSTSVNNISI